MAAAAPKTLEELAQRAGIQAAELAEFEEDVFMKLLEEQDVNAVAQHRLRKKFRDLKTGQRHATAQEKFQQMLTLAISTKPHGAVGYVGGAHAVQTARHLSTYTTCSSTRTTRRTVMYRYIVNHVG